MTTINTDTLRDRLHESDYEAEAERRYHELFDGLDEYETADLAHELLYEVEKDD